MDRRGQGALLLAVALMLVLIVPKALDPGESGTATRALLPAPPPAGSCLVGWNNELVPCSEPHELEVTASWAAEDPVRPRGRLPEACIGAAAEYVGRATENIRAGWDTLRVNYEVSALRAPSDERVRRLGWKACTIKPIRGGSYIGTVAGLTRARDRPGAYGSCGLLVTSGSLGRTVDIGCGLPHDVEILATASSFIPNDPDVGGFASFADTSSGNLAAECDAMAADLLNTEDPSYGGLLAIELARDVTIGATYSSAASEVGGEIISGASIKGTQVTATCVVQAVDGRSLTDSMVGLGDGPVPLG